MCLKNTTFKVVNDTKIYQKMKSKSWLSMEKKHYKMRKNVLIRNYFHLENLFFFLELG